jgi:hypothetical protein
LIIFFNINKILNSRISYMSNNRKHLLDKLNIKGNYEE